jgi:hypothetical protein
MVQDIFDKADSTKHRVLPVPVNIGLGWKSLTVTRLLHGDRYYDCKKFYSKGH